MRHRKKNQKLSKSVSQRKALIRSLVRSLLISERIETITRRAKSLSSSVERLITFGKKGSLHSKRIAYSFLQDHLLVKRLFEDIAPRFNKTAGGYTRIIPIGKRKGDDADLSIIELTKLSEKKSRIRKEKKPELAVVGVDETGNKSKKEQKDSRSGLRKSLRDIFKKKQ